MSSIAHTPKPRSPKVLSRDEIQRLQWLEVREAEMEADEAQYAKVYGWLRYHTWSAKHSPEGFPDDVLVRGPDLIFLENKREHERYQPTAAQREWYAALRQVRNVHVEVVRPHDMDRIAKMLERGLE